MTSSELIFGKYEMVERLARGGMGEVYLARQKVAGFERLVILKSLIGELAVQEGFVDQFLNEARVTAALNHPNVVSIYEVGAWRGKYFIALEYIDGVDLSVLQRSARAREFAIPFAISAKIIHDAALGLGYAARATASDGRALEIVHRDISPHNIMVRRDGVVKLVDFGIAKSTAQSSDTSTGVVKGKIQYMPPEQVRGEKLDTRTDIYSLGVVLWELCAGKPLFRGHNEFNTLQRVLNQPIPRLDTVVERVPAALVEVTARMLQRDREDRIASADEVARELAEISALSEADVAVFVEGVVGVDLETRTRSLQKPPSDFVIDFSNPNVNPEGTPTTHTEVPVAARSQAFLAAGVIAALAVLGILIAIVLNTEQDATPVPVLAPPTSTTLTLRTSPDHAAVYLGERLLGHTPLTTSELPSDEALSLLVKRTGHEDRTFEFTLQAGTNRVVELELQAIEAPTIAPETTPRKTRTKRRAPSIKDELDDGFLSVSVKPWARVWVDGEIRGETPIYKLRLPPGAHVVRLVNDDAGLDLTQKILIRSDKTTKIVR